MFQNLNKPTEYDYVLIKLIFQYMSENEREQFETHIIKSFSYNDAMTVQELAKTIIAIKSEANYGSRN